MATWKRLVSIVTVLALALGGMPRPARAQGSLSPAYLDELLAPIALYPDQLLAQILMSSGNARKVGELDAWLKKNANLKGSELQEAAQGAGFEPSLVALSLFPQVVTLMAGNLQWTSQIGGAFAVDRDAVFESIQRLRGKSQAVGNLKSTPQQKVETRTTDDGQQVIVIEPANPQVIYVPQYNPTVVYTQPAPTTTTVVVHEDDDDDAAVVGALVGFTAGIAIGAAFNNNYYYGPYGWGRPAPYMYGGSWNNYYDDRMDAREDWYENREDAREDYADHREDMAENRSDRAENAREQRSERSQNAQEQRTERTEQRSEQRGERSGQAQEQRTQRQEQRSSGDAQAQRQQRASDAKAARTSGASTQSASASGQRSTQRSQASGDRSGTRSDAFSNYSSGKSTRSASERGTRSRSSSSGSRSRSGGGRRR